MTVRAVMFDLDGTLLDTLDDICVAGNHALETCGSPGLAREEYRRLVGMGARRCMERALGEGAEHRVDEALGLYQSYYAEHPVVHTRPYEGVAELITELAERRVPMAVVTNKTHAVAVEVIRYFFAVMNHQR